MINKLNKHQKIRVIEDTGLETTPVHLIGMTGLFIENVKTLQGDRARISFDEKPAIGGGVQILCYGQIEAINEKFTLSPDTQDIEIVLQNLNMAIGKVESMIDFSHYSNDQKSVRELASEIVGALDTAATMLRTLNTENFAQSDLIARLESEKAFAEESSDKWMDAHDDVLRKLKDSNLENETLRRHLDVTEHGLFIPPTKSMEILRAGEIYERCERLAAEVDKYKREIGIHKFSKVWNYLTTMACKFDTDYRQWYLDAIKNLPDHLEKFRD